jgi:hypothetical protein
LSTKALNAALENTFRHGQVIVVRVTHLGLPQPFKALDRIRSMNAILYLCINEGHEQVDEVSAGDILKNFILAE